MLTADYTAISVLIVLTLWAGAKRVLRGKHLSSAASRLTSANAPSDGLQNPRRATRFLIEIEAE